MTEEFQQNLGLFFIAYPTVIIIIVRVLAKLPISHPFIVLNWGLVTMGAGLSTTQWLFNTGVAATLLLSLYLVLMLPTKEALENINQSLTELTKINKPVSLYQVLLSRFR